MSLLLVRTLLTALLAAAALAGVTGAGGTRDGRVLAVEWEAGGGQLRWAAAETLKAVGPPALNVGGAPANVTAVSPDGSAVAIGGGDGGRLRIVDLDTLQTTALLRLGGGFVTRGIWSAPDRLHVLHLGTPNEVVTVDPQSERVLERRKLQGGGAVLTTLRAGGRIVALVTPLKGVGPARLAVVDRDGSPRTVRLLGVSAGFAPTRSATARTPIARQLLPGLAVSPDGERAAVVATEKVVIVDLSTLEQRTVKLATRGLTAVQKVPMSGWQRTAIWLSNERFAVVGQTYTVQDNRIVARTIGLRMLDLERESVRTLDEKATGLMLVGDTLLAYGGSALRGFTLGGKLRFEALSGERTGYVQAANGRAYVGEWTGSGYEYTIVEIASGRVLGRIDNAKPIVILDPDG